METDELESTLRFLRRQFAQLRLEVRSKTKPLDVLQREADAMAETLVQARERLRRTAARHWVIVEIVPFPPHRKQQRPRRSVLCMLEGRTERPSRSRSTVTELHLKSPCRSAAQHH